MARRIFFWTLVVTLSILISFSAFTSSPHVFAVNPVYYVAHSPSGSGLSGGSCFAPGFNTIQAAVSSAPSGSTILVCPGTYKEQVTIAKSITLRGFSPRITTILAPSTMGADDHTFYNIVTISGSPTIATLSGFTISGPVSHPCDTSAFGILVSDGAYANIYGNTVAHVKDSTPSSSCYGATAIGVGTATPFTSTSTSTASAAVSRNIIFDYQRDGIDLAGSGSSATVSGNIITGLGVTNTGFQNGIEMDNPTNVAGITATISGNTISANECESGSSNPVAAGASPCGSNLEAATQSGGISIFGTPGSGSTIIGNAVFGNDAGIALSGDGAGFQTTGLTVSRNYLENNRYTNLVLFDYASDNTFTMNLLSITNPNAQGAACTTGPSCLSPNSYTLGIDVLYYSNGNTFSHNIVVVTADLFAVYIGLLCSSNVVTSNFLVSNHGTNGGNSAVQDLGTSDTVSSNFG